MDDEQREDEWNCYLSECGKSKDNCLSVCVLSQVEAGANTTYFGVCASAVEAKKPHYLCNNFETNANQDGR